MKSDPVVVVGHHGFIGAAVVKKLEAAGRAVVGVSSAEVDLTSEGAGGRLAAKIPDGATVMVLAAVTPDRGVNLDTFARNVAIATAVARAMEARTIARCVYVSSDAVYGDREDVDEASPAAPKGLYAVAKLASEEILASVAAARKTPLLLLRPTLVFGPGDPHRSYGPNRFAFTARTDHVVRLFGEGEELRDHLYVEDFAEATRRILEDASLSGVLNLATGESRSFAACVETLAKVAPFAFEVQRAPRGSAIVHRRFDVRRLRAALPGLRFTPFEDALRASVT